MIKANMNDYAIKDMENEAEIDGKGYVHYKSWHETYAGLIDAEHLARHTLEKCTAIAHRWTDNIVGFVGYGAYRDATLPAHGEAFSLYVLAEYQGRKIGYELMNAALERLSAYDRVAVRGLKGNDVAISFYEKYGFHFDGTESAITLGTPNTELRMIYQRR